MTLERCAEIALALSEAESVGEEQVTMFTTSTAFRIDHPSEPLLAVFANGSWQVAYDGDIQWMSDGAPIHNDMVNAIPLKAILEDLERFLLIDRQNHG